MNLDLLLVVFQAVVFVFAISAHELVHAWAALRLGDTTAYMLGRVTLNPARHIDPWGSVIMPLISLALSGFMGPIIGWGKPVPVTLRNFRRLKRDDVLSTSAGLFSHLAMALVAALLLIVLKHVPGLGINAVLAAMLMTRHAQGIDMTALPRLFPIALLLYYFVVMNVILFIFQLIPVPPLDGSRLIRYVLPYNAERAFDRIGMLGSFFIFVIAWRVLYPILYPPLSSAFDRLLLSF